jgi:EAL and modified HD-GYP domain-containing signal transduction protein
MKNNNISEGFWQPIFVARQPIFNRERKVWGYELLFRHSLEINKASVIDGELATQKVIADGFVLATSGMPSHLKCLINFPQKLLLDDSALALPPDRCVVEVLENVEPVPEIIEACQRLKKAGYLLALDDFVGQPGYEPLLELADIVKVDVLPLSKDEFIELAGRLKQYSCKMLAEKVEGHRMFALASHLGFDLFQGFFFSKPEIVSGKKLSAEELTRLQLLKELSRSDFDFARMRAIVEKDVSLTYRLLKYINSASFGLDQKIDSIGRAMVLLGRDRLLQWLRVVVMSDMDSTPGGREVMLLSAQRGRFLQLLALRGQTKLEPDGMFLLGFLSLLDVLLKQPLEDLLSELPLDEKLKMGLLDKKDPCHRWLELARCQERGDWPCVVELIEILELDPSETALCFVKASKWAQEILNLS